MALTGCPGCLRCRRRRSRRRRSGKRARRSTLWLWWTVWSRGCPAAPSAPHPWNEGMLFDWRHFLFHCMKSAIHLPRKRGSLLQSAHKHALECLSVFRVDGETACLTEHDSAADCTIHGVFTRGGPPTCDGWRRGSAQWIRVALQVAVVGRVGGQVGNFRVEPPGLFRGRGEHPKMGKLKRRILPKCVSTSLLRCGSSQIPRIPDSQVHEDWNTPAITPLQLSSPNLTRAGTHRSIVQAAFRGMELVIS